MQRLNSEMMQRPVSIRGHALSLSNMVRGYSSWIIKGTLLEVGERSFGAREVKQSNHSKGYANLN